MSAFISALRQQSRVMLRTPVFALLCAVTLGLGIGATATMFGVVDRLLLQAPQYLREPERLARFYITIRHEPAGFETSSIVGYSAYAALRDGTHAFDGVAAYQSSSWIVGTGNDARRLPGVAASADFFSLIGVQPVLGRLYTRAEDQPNSSSDVVVLDHDYWVRDFGADHGVLGRTLTIANRPFTIIGVLPAGFTGVELHPVDYWFPLSSGAHPRQDWPTTWNARWLQIVGRVKRGAARDEASRDATVAFRHAYSGTTPNWKDAAFTVRPLSYTPEGEERPEASVSRWLIAVSVIVLIIACANVGNLLLARTIRRRREIAVRLALGMGHARLVQLLLAESLMIATLGGVVGVGLAYGGGELIRRVFLSDIIWTSRPVDMTMLIVVEALTLMVAVGISLMPVIEAQRTDIAYALSTGSRQGGKQHNRLRAALLISQTTLTVVLLVGAGLFVRSLMHVRALDLGVQTDRVLSASIFLPRAAATNAASSAAQQVEEWQLWDRLHRTVSEDADFESASLAIGSPFGSAFGLTVRAPGRDSLPQLGGGGPYVSAVTGDYFKTVGTRLLHGRVFGSGVETASERTAIVNETTARTLWPNGDALGKCLTIGDNQTQCAMVVGIVANAHRWGIREEPAIQIYIPFGQESGISGTALLVRPRPGVPGAALTLRRLIMQVMPDARFIDVAAMQDRVDPQIRPWRLGAAMFGLFGCLALLVAAAGLYSVVSYVASERTHEIGVRIAIGAQTSDILGSMLAHGLKVAAAGGALGFILSIWAAQALAPRLFDESPYDPVVYGGVAVTILFVSLSASFVPALRAARVDPVTALRAE